MNLAGDNVEVLRRQAAPLQVFPARVDEHLHGRQRVAQLVSHPRGELADGRQLLGPQHLPLALVHPFPEPSVEQVAKAAPFMARLEAFLRERVDSDAIDRDGKIPDDVVDELRAMGAFGIKIDEAYGGLGLSQLMYTKAIGMVTSQDGSLTALLFLEGLRPGDVARVRASTGESTDFCRC